MRIGLYLFAAITLTIFIGVIAYFINPANYMVSAFGLNLNLPVAIWIILPMSILLVFSALHILYYGTKNFFKLRAWRKDMQTLEDGLYWSILQEPKGERYTTQEMQDGASFLSEAKVLVSRESEIKNEKIKEAAEIVNKIMDGEYVDLKNISKRISKENPINVQNMLNRLNSDSKFITIVLKDNAEYPKDIVSEAVDRFVEDADFSTAIKYINLLSKEHFYTMLARMDDGETLGLDAEIAKKFIEALGFECVDYIMLAAAISKSWQPDSALSFFNGLRKEDEKPESGYLYLLFVYEMLSEVKDFFEANPENEFKKFKMFYALKQTGTGYKISELLDISTLCDED
ncbi:MAG: hypothetical protein JXQ68_07180 [Campylobacterales bacterium]|nr:hypothetical protein [Campylobacterales bacterium]